MKDPSIYYMGDQPYDHYGEYLEDLFDVLLYQTAGQKIVFLENRIEDRGLDIKQNLSDWETMIRDRRSFSMEMGMRFPVEEVLVAVQGDAFVRNVLILSMMIVLEKEYEQVLSQLKGLMNSEPMPLVMLWGPEGSGKRHVLKHAATQEKRALVFFDISWGMNTGAYRNSISFFDSALSNTFGPYSGNQ